VEFASCEPKLSTMAIPAMSELDSPGHCTQVRESSVRRHPRYHPQPLGLFVTPVSTPGGALDGIGRYYVSCVKDRTIPVSLQRRMITENEIANVIELDTDHTPHLSMTAVLADTLRLFARHVADAG
jgi:hypothetical protein